MGFISNLRDMFLYKRLREPSAVSQRPPIVEIHATSNSWDRSLSAQQAAPSKVIGEPYLLMPAE